MNGLLTFRLDFASARSRTWPPSVGSASDPLMTCPLSLLCAFASSSAPSASFIISPIPFVPLTASVSDNPFSCAPVPARKPCAAVENEPCVADDGAHELADAELRDEKESDENGGL